MATLDRPAEIESKKSIKSRFEYDLDQILAGGRLDRISLVDGWWSRVKDCLQQSKRRGGGDQKISKFV